MRAVHDRAHCQAFLICDRRKEWEFYKLNYIKGKGSLINGSLVSLDDSFSFCFSSVKGIKKLLLTE